MDPKYLLDKISDASCYLVHLNALINEKWYDNQEQFIKCLESIKYDLLTIESMVKQEITKDEMCKKLRNLCDIFSACENCPLYQIKIKKLKCDVSEWDKLSKLKFEEVTELYNSVEEWVKNFTLDD